MKNYFRLTKSGVIRKKGMYSLIMLTVFSLFMLACIHPDKGKTKKESQKKGQGIILNVAADALIGIPKWGADIDLISKEQAIAALEEYVSLYANTQVNRLLFNVNYLRACYDSKVMTPYWDVPDPATNTSGWHRNYWQIHKKGIDVFEVCVAKSRALEISPWLSFRMNDHHYHENPYCLNKLMLENPDLRLSPTGSFDYARNEVREYYKSFIKEALERYDVDGIELDWMRTFNLFKPGMESQGIEIINNFMKEIRSIVDQNAKERGHSIEIAARVPVTPAIGRSFGLDGTAWVKNHSVDILIPTNFWYPTNFDVPVELWKREIGKKNSSIIAPGADLAFMSKSVNSMGMFNSIETMRGFAISAYSRGAGSVYLFNNFDLNLTKKIVSPDGSTVKVNDKPAIIKEGGMLSTIEGKPRRHVFTYNNPDITDPMPFTALVLKKEDKFEFDIYSGPKPSKGNYKGNYIVCVALGPMTGYKDADLEVKVNDKSCSQIEDMPRDPAFNYDEALKRNRWSRIVQNVSETGVRLMQFKADLKAVKDGYNHISIINNSKEPQELTWLEVYID